MDFCKLCPQASPESNGLCSFLASSGNAASLSASGKARFFIQGLAFPLHGDCPYPSPILVPLDLGEIR